MDFKSDSRFKEAIKSFDSLNSKDPSIVEGQPKELGDALAMTRWVEALYPNAKEAVHLAARCQHLCRWQIPRSSYPKNRMGYLKWRSDLKEMHAEKSTAVLRQVGYDDEVIGVVRAINLKRGLKSNPDVQAIEDALCLVFLELQYEKYIGAWGDDKVVSILKKTWLKMSPIAREMALELPLSRKALDLVQKAQA